MIGASEAMQRAFALIESVAPTGAPVLVLGESGTGKDLVARALHACSDRARNPFVAVNCAALQENLLESELFGHVRGAFSGAIADKPGLMEAASGGTLFLDEVAEMAPALQAKLLRALEQGEIRRVGDVRTRKVDLRVVAATHQDLIAAVREGRFREDLYYRLNVLQVRLPPLRERGEDIIALATRALERLSGGRIRGFTARALDTLRRHDWPGNVRELHNAMQYVAAVCRETVADREDLPERLREGAGGESPALYGDLLALPYGEARQAFLAQFERLYVRHSLERAQGSVTAAARLAGMDRSNFRRLKQRALAEEHPRV